MQFETFNRDEAARLIDPVGPVVRVTTGGTLLFNRPAAGFLDEHWAGPRPEVTLLFSAESRTAGVHPLTAAEASGLRLGELWPLKAQRSLGWPQGVSAAEFVKHYRIGAGEYPAGLMRGPGARMVTFVAGPRRSPSQRRAWLARAGAAR